MAFSNSAVLTQLNSTLAALSGMGVSQIGAPESVGPRVSAYVTLGSQSVSRIAGGLVQRESRFFCMFAYRLDGAEATAETTLAAAVDAFMQAIQDDLTLGDNVETTEVSSHAADEPDYQLRAGKEYREYPVMITATQRSTYEVNP